MFKAFKFFVALLIFVAVAGCATRNSAKVAATVDKDFVNVYDAFEMAKKGEIEAEMADVAKIYDEFRQIQLVGGDLAAFKDAMEEYLGGLSIKELDW